MVDRRIIILVLILVNICGAVEYETDAPVIIDSREILKNIELGIPVEYDHMTLVGELNLSKLSATKLPVETSSSKPTGKIIPQSIIITNSNVLESVKLENAIFQNSIVFDGTSFIDNVTFMNSSFEEDVSFKGSEFDGELIFSFAKFNEDVDFKRSQFNRSVYFNNANFHEGADFKGSHFRSSRSGERISFRNVLFDGDANFRQAEFYNDVYFRQGKFNKTADFKNAQFYRLSDFDISCFAEDVSFEFAQFQGDAYFRNAQFNGILNFRDIRFNRLHMTWAAIKSGLICDGPVYLELIDNFRNLEQLKDADDCYYQYRHQSQFIKSCYDLSKYIDYLAWLTCGYGVRPSHTIFTIVSSIIFFGAIYFLGGAIQNQTNLYKTMYANTYRKKRNLSIKTASDSFYFSLLIFTFQARGDLRAGGIYKYVAVVEGIVGILLFALLAVTLGNIMIR